MKTKKLNQNMILLSENNKLKRNSLEIVRIGNESQLKLILFGLLFRQIIDWEYFEHILFSYKRMNKSYSYLYFI